MTGGEVWSDEKETITCLACGQDVTDQETGLDAPELRPGWTYLKSQLPPTPEITAAEDAAHAAWKMYNRAIDDREFTRPGCLTWDEINKLGNEASACDETCRRMWQELYARHNGIE